MTRTPKNPRTRNKASTNPRPARKRYAGEHGITRRGPRGGGDGSVEPPELDQGDDQVAAERAPTIPPDAVGGE